MKIIVKKNKEGKFITKRFQMNFSYRHNEKVVWLRRISLIFGTMVYVFSAFLDFMLGPKQIGICLIIRFGITMPFFLCTILIEFSSLKTNLRPYIMAILGLLAAISILVIMVHIGPSAEIIYPYGVIIALLWVYICSGVEYKFSFVLNFFIVIAFLITITFFEVIPIKYRISQMFFTIVFSFIGAMTSVLIQGAFLEAAEKKYLLEKSRKEVEELLQTKTLTYINLAHEIKTPLTLISVYFKKYMSNKQPSEELCIIKDNLNRLEHDIVNFLEIEKVSHESDSSQTEYKAEHTSLSAVIYRLLPLFSNYYCEKGLTLSEDVADNIYVDLSEIDCEHIVLNLMENAYKYTNSGGRVQIKLDLNNDGNALLLVKDTGWGINPEQMEHIFLPYNQAGMKNKQSQGLGMGLAIVKLIVDKKSGIIDVKSKMGVGTEFLIKLPLSKTPEEECFEDHRSSLPVYFPGFPRSEAEPSFKSDIYKPNLVIIEDEENLRTFLVEEFQEEYEVKSFSNGREALNYLLNSPAQDLILSDVMMDGMDGLTFLQELKASNIEYIPPVFFLSANSFEGIRIKGLSLGAVDFIQKPFNIEELSLKLRSWINCFSKEHRISERRMLLFLQKEYALSARELQVAALLMKGESRNRISEKLFISTNTVKTHIGMIYIKCRVNSKTEFLDMLLEKV